jgi:hypothetical protein
VDDKDGVPSERKVAKVYGGFRERKDCAMSDWKEQQDELGFETAMREIDLSLRNAEGAENRDDFVAGLDDAIADLEMLTKELRELRSASR